MTEKEGKREESDETQYREAVRAMERGDEAAKTTVAYFKLSGRGGAEVGVDEAVVLLEERVKDRDCEAMWMLGLCCEHGMGTEKDIERADVLYQESCEGGNDVGYFLKENRSGRRGSGSLFELR